MHCESKRAYHTPEAAARAARGRAREGVTYLRVYACPECGAFHLTSKRPDEVERLSGLGAGRRGEIQALGPSLSRVRSRSRLDSLRRASLSPAR